MKRYLLIGLILFSYLFLIGCASNRNPYLRTDYTEETWMREVHTTPNSWARGADSWFLTGDANSAERSNRSAPYSAAISTMTVAVPDFTGIRVIGDFQVQLFGSYDHNTVYVYGPNDGVREIAIQVRGNTLCIEQTKNATSSVKKVIIRIGIRQLCSIVQLGGCGSIEGIRLNSRSLDIMTSPATTGNMYLTGPVNLRRVTNLGKGNISVFGANSASLDIRAIGNGDVNVSGNLNLRSIYHGGGNHINVIGANTRTPLKVYAEGAGKIGINGRVNLRRVTAKGATRVYIYPVFSQSIHAFAYNNARIGLAGSTTDLSVDTRGKSRFWGKHLCAQNAYVRAYDQSHINVTATSKIFASATQNASVYFFGSPESLSQFVSGSGVVIPVRIDGRPSCGMVFEPRVYKSGDKRAVSRYRTPLRGQG